MVKIKSFISNKLISKKMLTKFSNFPIYKLAHKSKGFSIFCTNNLPLRGISKHLPVQIEANASKGQRVTNQRFNAPKEQSKGLLYLYRKFGWAYRRAYRPSSTGQLISGEIYKENFTDILNTSSEQIAFSLKVKDTLNYESDGIRYFKGKNFKDSSINRKKEVSYFLCPRGITELMSLPMPLPCTCPVVARTCIASRAYLTSSCLFLPRSCFAPTGHHVHCMAKRGKKRQEDNAPSYKSKICTQNKRGIQSKQMPCHASSCPVVALPLRGITCIAWHGIKSPICNSICNKGDAHKACLAPFIEKNKTLPLRIKVGDYVTQGDKIYKVPSFIKGRDKIFVKKIKTISRQKATTSNFRAWESRFGRSTPKTFKSEGSDPFRASKACSCPQLPSTKFNFVGRHHKGKNLHKKSFRNIQKIPLISGTSGKIIRISKNQITFQKVQPVLFYSNANLHVRHGDWIERGSPILTLTHQTLITGDIVQGIPRIEQLFEAFTSPPAGIKETNNLHNTLHTQVRDIFRKAWLQNVLPIAVRQSLEEIQQILVESIQKVYLAQGVLIADKHIEIIVRQMTSKVEILDAGSTGLMIEEVLNLRQIENANLTTPGKKALYAPAVVGLTQAALGSDSFISAASFQETTRVLSRDAVIGKSDFLRGLKEKVVIGDLISAGTGLDIYFIYNLLPHKLMYKSKICSPVVATNIK